MRHDRAITLLLEATLVAGLLAGVGIDCSAQQNDFFGAQVPQGSSSSQKQAAPYGGSNALPQGDFTEDERRMQKKYRNAVKHAQKLIEKGEKMMADGQKKNSDKMLKKGRVFKDIGEKRLAELKSNNPLADLTPGGANLEEGNAKTADSGTTTTH